MLTGVQEGKIKSLPVLETNNGKYHAVVTSVTTGFENEITHYRLKVFSVADDHDEKRVLQETFKTPVKILKFNDVNQDQLVVLTHNRINFYDFTFSDRHIQTSQNRLPISDIKFAKPSDNRVLMLTKCSLNYEGEQESYLEIPVLKPE